MLWFRITSIFYKQSKAKQMEANRERVQVHKLPTEDKSDIIEVSKYDQINYREFYGDADLHMGDEYQHLYFTTDEEIEEGDWTINLKSRHTHKEVCRIENEIELERYANNPENDCRKIIATTDPKLTIVTGRLKKRVLTKSLPQPSQALIKAYCEQGGFDEVDVEYTEIMFPLKERMGIKEREFILKVDPIHNTITTHRIVEKIYSISDIEAYCDKYPNDTELGREIRKLRYKQ